MEINGIEVSPALAYSQMELPSGILQALEKKGFTQATPVQAGAIPYFMDWQDVIAKAPTGTGKTYSFGIPMVSHIDSEKDEVQALILAPTRELAMQIQLEIRDLCAYLPGIRSVCLYGGQPITRQITQLKKRPQLVVATPGRLMDHMKRKTVRLNHVQTVVLDEADRMLDMGFVRDVRKILDSIPSKKNLGLFSATISREVMDISWVYQRDPVEIVVRPIEEDKPDITQYRIKVDQSGKVDAFLHIMSREQTDHVIAFCNTKNTTDRLCGLLQQRGLSAQAIHGDLGQKQREAVMDTFRKGDLRILVATDVAARGLDIDDVDTVVNYDIPEETEYYIHRIGRTGRAKRRGAAYSLVSSVTDGIRLDEIIRATGMPIEEIAWQA